MQQAPYQSVSDTPSSTETPTFPTPRLPCRLPLLWLRKPQSGRNGPASVVGHQFTLGAAWPATGRRGARGHPP
jgi:hypothetical protein